MNSSEYRAFVHKFNNGDDSIVDVVSNENTENLDIFNPIFYGGDKIVSRVLELNPTLLTERIVDAIVRFGTPNMISMLPPNTVNLVDYKMLINKQDDRLKTLVLCGHRHGIQGLYDAASSTNIFMHNKDMVEFLTPYL